MKQLKIKKEFWDHIVSGEKKYEFRKLEKGLTTGTYRFIDAEKNYKEVVWCNGCYELNENCYRSADCLYDKNSKVKKLIEYKKVFGTVKLKTIAINPEITHWRCDKLKPYYKNKDCDCLKRHTYFWSENYTHLIDDETYKFVKENYIDEGIDFVVYEISEVKEIDNVL